MGQSDKEWQLLLKPYLYKDFWAIKKSLMFTIWKCTNIIFADRNS